MPAVEAQVVEPADAPALSAVLRQADADGQSVLPRGGGTKLEWANRSRPADVVVSTTRLDQIVDHAWADLTVTVQAGCTIQVLQDRLREHGQRVGVDPLWPERATVGGVLSANDTGALRLKIGGLRDLVIGVTLALADGTLASSGGRVVKNVAGYDLSKLSTGAFGTLGVITSAIFRLHPLPAQARSWSFPVASLADMQRLIDALQDSQLAHTSLQTRVSSASAPIVDVLFEGRAAGIDAQSRQARALAGNAPVDDAPASVWQARQDLWASTGPIVKLSVLPADLAKTMETIAPLALARELTWQAVFHATGLGWIRFDGAPAGWSALVRELRAGVERAGGSLTVLRSHAPCDAWGSLGDAAPLMRAVKYQFDPKNTL